MKDYIILFLQKIKLKYNHILYLLGFGWSHIPIINNDTIIQPKEKIIEIKLDSNYNIHINNLADNSKKSYIILIINIIYNLIISSFLGWSIVYSIYLFYEFNSLMYFFDNIYQLLFIFQYIYGSIYFSLDHLYNIIKSHQNYYIYYGVYLFIALILSILIASITVLVLVFNQNISIYLFLLSQIGFNNPLRYLLYVVLFIDKFLCYFTLFVNMVSFSIVLLYHKIRIKDYVNSIDNYEGALFSTIVTHVSNETSNMREEYSNSVTKLNYIYTLFNIFGFIGLYFTFNNYNSKNIFVIDILTTMIFILITSIHLNIINVINNDITLIKKKMISKKYIMQIMDTVSSDKIIMESNNNLNNNINNDNCAKILQIMTWNVTIDLLDIPWDTFSILGFPIANSNIIEKIFGTIMTYLIAQAIISITGIGIGN